MLLIHLRVSVDVAMSPERTWHLGLALSVAGRKVSR